MFLCVVNKRNITQTYRNIHTNQEELMRVLFLIKIMHQTIKYLLIL